jgi:hypothetical protein
MATRIPFLQPSLRPADCISHLQGTLGAAVIIERLVQALYWFLVFFL